MLTSGLANDIGSALVDYGPIAVIISLLFVFTLYLISYLNRYFHYLKTKEFVYLDDSTLEFVKKVIQTVIMGLAIIGAIYIASLISLDVRNAFIVIMNHMPSIFFVIIVIFIAVIIVRLLRRFGEYLRGNLKKKPKDVVPHSTLEYAEVALKYAIFIVAGMIALIGGLALLPPGENPIRDYIFNIGNAVDPALAISLITAIILVIIITIIISRFLDTFYEDLKKRSTKYSVRINEILKGMSKNVLYIVAMIIGLFIVLSKFLSYTELLLTLGLVILLFVLVAFLASDLIRNSFSGLSLMISDPFSEGNRIEILDNMVCDVVAMNLAYTTVKTQRGEVVNVPNTELIKHKIVNLSRSETFALSVKLGINRNVPPQKVEELLIKAAEKTSRIINEPKAEIFGEEFKENSIVYELLTYTNSPKDLKRTKSELVYNIQQVLKEEGISSQMSS
jgi:small-conductance mechanosensitive channel